jgi:hypothetical protein
MARRVEISSLAQGAELGSGGQGKVVAVNGTLVDGKWPAVLKTYKNSVAFNAKVLEDIVAFPDQLPAGDRDWLMRTTAWPWAMAVDRGTPKGLLMRMVPASYEFSFTTVTLGNKAMLSTVEYLLNSDDYIRSAGISINDRERLSFLSGLADTISRLHSRGVVVGDLSPKNLLFNPNSYSNCFLIDCDAVALHGKSALGQVDTPDWEIPAYEGKGTEATDSYKFGLLAIRLFAKDQSTHDTSAISFVSTELGRLATLSQDSDPRRRPAPAAWIDAIHDATRTSSWQAIPPNQPTWTGSAPKSYQSTPGYKPAGTAAGSAPRRKSRAGAVGATALALLVVALVAFGIDHHHSAGASSALVTGGSASQNNAAPDATTPTSAPAPPPPPTHVGVVAMSSGIRDDPQAVAVGRMFNTYFTGIDKRHYSQTLSVFDPSGIVDPNVSSQAQHFIDGVDTSSDSGMELVSVDPSDGSIVDSAEIRFTSHQKAGFGPKDDPESTCTDWDINYVLTQGSSGGYLINKVSGATDSAC